MKYIHTTLIVVLTAVQLLSVSCKSLPDNPPIPQKEMSKILLDIQIAETYSQGLGDSVTNKFEKNYDSLSGFYGSVLKKHHISFEEFDDALNWYESKPVLMDSLMKSTIELIAEIKTKEKISDYNPEKEKQKADSLKALQAKDTLKKDNKTDSLKKKTADTSGNVKNPRLMPAKRDSTKVNRTNTQTKKK